VFQRQGCSKSPPPDLKDYIYIDQYISTFKKARDFKDILHPNGNITPIKKVLFQKVKKAFSQKDFKLAL
jgi:hypothetical protein